MTSDHDKPASPFGPTNNQPVPPLPGQALPNPGPVSEQTKREMATGAKQSEHWRQHKANAPKS